MKLNVKIISIIIILVFITTLCSSLFTMSVAQKNTINKSTIDEEIDWWSTINHDNKNTGHSTSSVPNYPNVLWNFTTDGVMYDSVIVSNHKVFVGTETGSVYCLDANTGNEIWSYQTEDRIRTVPAVFEGCVLITNNEGKVYCINATYGNTEWIFSRNDIDYLDSSPKVWNNMVYIGGSNGHLYCLDAKSGNIIWDFYDKDVLFCTPAINDGKVYVGSKYSTYKMYCLDANTGDELWRSAISLIPHGFPVIYKNTVFINCWYRFHNTEEGGLYCLDADNGFIRWDEDLNDWLISPPSIWEDHIYYGVGKKLCCLNINSQEKIWEFKADGRVDNAPSIADGKVLFSSFYDGSITCVDALNGSKIWDYKTGYWVSSTPAIANERVYVSCGNKNVYCFGLMNQKSLLFGLISDKKEKEDTTEITAKSLVSISMKPIQLNTYDSDEVIVLYNEEGKSIGNKFIIGIYNVAAVL